MIPGSKTDTANAANNARRILALFWESEKNKLISSKYKYKQKNNKYPNIDAILFSCCIISSPLSKTILAIFSLKCNSEYLARI